jgi:protein-tyrosine phosphatase
VKVLELADCAHRIIDGLWVSGMPDPNWDIDRWGVQLVVTVSDHLPPQAARRDEWGTNGDAVGEGRIIYLHWPIEDGDVPAWEPAAFITHAVTVAVRRGWTVLLHCYEGRNRSGLIAALAYRTLTGCTGADAVDHVRSCRPGMLSNREFAQALQKLPAPS